MSGKPRKTPSAKAQAYIDAYLRHKGASCSDIDRMFGVERTTSSMLRRWGIPQRYEPGGGNLNLLRNNRQSMTPMPVKRRKALRVVTPLTAAEVARRLIERRMGGKHGQA